MAIPNDTLTLPIARTLPIAATSDGGAMGARLLDFKSIPVIDIASLAGSDAAAFAATAAEISKACQQIGFFYIKNHGVPQALIDRAYALSRAFHTSPPERRLQVHIQNSQGTRGWDPSIFDYKDPDPELYRLTPLTDPNDDHIARGQLYSAFDLSIEIDRQDPDFRAGNVMLVPNQWPDWLPGFREGIIAYYDAVTEVGTRLFGAFAAALDLPDDFFSARARKPPSQLRLLHYPANTLPMNNKNPGIGAHSDFECFTILNQMAPGLQVMNAADEWIEAPPIEGTFIVNIGDMLEGWTNSLFKATQHRVVNTGRERFSMPLFFSVDYHTEVEPLPQFVSETNPPRYSKIVAGDHLAGFSINNAKHMRKRVITGELKIPFAIHGENPFKRRAVNEFEDLQSESDPTS